jgi:Protein of unknown function (DUF3515)
VLVATAVAVPVTVLLALALHRPTTPPVSVATAPPTTAGALGPVTVAAPPPSPTAARDCPAVISHLPATLAGRPARQATSTSPYVASWGDPPLILRCGVPRPPGFTGGSELSQVDGVQWFPTKHGTDMTWTAVDRGAYVELTVPGGLTGTAIVELSDALSQALPARQLDPGSR